MQTKKTQSKKESVQKASKSMLSSQLMELFEDELKDIYWAEKAMTKALPKMAKNATEPKLVEALQSHLAETEKQVQKLEKVFELMDKKATAKKCEAMAGLIKEAGEIMEETEKGPQRDAGIISAGQKVEHYEIATYGTLRTFAQTLGLNEVSNILEEILGEEKNADQTLTKIAESTINVEAMEEEEAEEE